MRTKALLLSAASPPPSSRADLRRCRRGHHGRAGLLRRAGTRRPRPSGSERHRAAGPRRGRHARRSGSAQAVDEPDADAVADDHARATPASVDAAPSPRAAGRAPRGHALADPHADAGGPAPDLRPPLTGSPRRQEGRRGRPKPVPRAPARTTQQTWLWPSSSSCATCHGGCRAGVPGTGSGGTPPPTRPTGSRPMPADLTPEQYAAWEARPRRRHAARGG